LIISIGKWAAPLCAQRSYVFIQPKEVKEEVGNCLQSNYNPPPAPFGEEAIIHGSFVSLFSCITPDHSARHLFVSNKVGHLYSL
jgi:hypothetical protein